MSNLEKHLPLFEHPVVLFFFFFQRLSKRDYGYSRDFQGSRSSVSKFAVTGELGEAAEQVAGKSFLPTPNEQIKRYDVFISTSPFLANAHVYQQYITWRTFSTFEECM